MNGFMLILGGFPFMLETAPFQSLARSSGWNWPEQQVIGSTPALQYTGKQAETVTLTGMLCPELTGDRSSLESLRLLADLGRPLPLVSGTGLFMGLWVIEELQQDEDVHFAAGVPRRCHPAAGQGPDQPWRGPCLPSPRPWRMPIMPLVSNTPCCSGVSAA